MRSVLANSVVQFRKIRGPKDIKKANTGINQTILNVLNKNKCIFENNKISLYIQNKNNRNVFVADKIKHSSHLCDPHIWSTFRRDQNVNIYVNKNKFTISNNMFISNYPLEFKGQSENITHPHKQLIIDGRFHIKSWQVPNNALNFNGACYLIFTGFKSAKKNRPNKLTWNQFLCNDRDIIYKHLLKTITAEKLTTDNKRIIFPLLIPLCEVSEYESFSTSNAKSNNSLDNISDLHNSNNGSQSQYQSFHSASENVFVKHQRYSPLTSHTTIHLNTKTDIPSLPCTISPTLVFANDFNLVTGYGSNMNDSLDTDSNNMKDSFPDSDIAYNNNNSSTTTVNNALLTCNEDDIKIQNLFNKPLPHFNLLMPTNVKQICFVCRERNIGKLSIPIECCRGGCDKWICKFHMPGHTCYECESDNINIDPNTKPDKYLNEYPIYNKCYFLKDNVVYSRLRYNNTSGLNNVEKCLHSDGIPSKDEFYSFEYRTNPQLNTMYGKKEISELYWNKESQQLGVIRQSLDNSQLEFLSNIGFTFLKLKERVEKYKSKKSIFAEETITPWNASNFNYVVRQRHVYRMQLMCPVAWNTQKEFRLTNNTIRSTLSAEDLNKFDKIIEQTLYFQQYAFETVQIPVSFFGDKTLGYPDLAFNMHGWWKGGSLFYHQDDSIFDNRCVNIFHFYSEYFDGPILPQRKSLSFSGNTIVPRYEGLSIYTTPGDHIIMGQKAGTKWYLFFPIFSVH
eukprot:264314_1